MASKHLVHTKRISTTHIRELSVTYDKGGINYFDYSRKPKGIFFSSTVFEQEEGSMWKTLKIGLGQSKPGTGYICVVPLDRYRPKAALFLGFTRAESARFSLLLSIPTTAAAGTLAMAEMVRTGDGAAGLHRDSARRQSGKKLEHLTPPQLAPQHRLSAGISPMQLEYILRQIEPDRGNLQHDRSLPWIVDDPPWHIRCRRGRSHHQRPCAQAGRQSYQKSLPADFGGNL